MKEKIENLLKEQVNLPFYLKYAKLSESSKNKMLRRKHTSSNTYQTDKYFVRENYKPII